MVTRPTRISFPNWHISWVVASRGAYSGMSGITPYAVTTFELLASVILLRAYIGSVNDNGLLVLQNALSLPIYTAIAIWTTFLAISASVSISKERESGTLEVLFYGPIDIPTYVIGKHLEQILLSSAMLPFCLAVLTWQGIASNVGGTWTIVSSLALSLFVASTISAFGIFLSSITTKMRTSLLVLVCVTAVLLLIPVAENALSGIDPREMPAVAFYARSMVSVATNLTKWISPFACLSRGMDSVYRGDMGGYFAAIGTSVIHSVVLLRLAVKSLCQKGVRS